MLPAQSNRQVAAADSIGSQLARGSTTGLFGRVAGYACQYAFHAVAARMLGSVVAGSFFAFLAFGTLLATATRAGLDRTGLRAISVLRRSSGPAAVRNAAIRLLAIVVGVSGLASVIAWTLRFKLAGLFHAGQSATALGIVMLAVPGLAVAFACGEYLRGLHLVGWAALVQLVVINGVAIAGLTLGMTMLRLPGIYVAALAFAAGTCCAALTALTVLRRHTRTPRDAPPGTPAPWSSLAGGAPMMFWTSMLMLGMSGLDVVFLGHLAPGKQTAFYVAAAKTALLPSIGLVAVNSILVPMAAAEFKLGTRESLERLMVTGARWSLAVGCVAVGGAALVGPWLLELFGPGFHLAYPVLLVLLLGQLVNAGSGGVAQLLLMTGHERRAAIVLTVVVGLLVPLYIAVIPRHGALGAAGVTAFGVVSWNIGMVRQARRHVRVRSYADTIPRALLFVLVLSIFGLATHHSTVGSLALIGLYCVIGPCVAWKLLLRADDRVVLGATAARVLGRRASTRNAT